MSEMENQVPHSPFTDGEVTLLRGEVNYKVTPTVLMASILGPTSAGSEFHAAP